MIQPTSLNSYTAKDLGQMAKRRGVAGWHSMRKEQLIQALTELGAENGGPPAAGANTPEPLGGAPPAVNRSATSSRRARTSRVTAERKDISSQTPANNQDSDRIVLMVRDAYWLHAYWEITNRAVIRAKAAMAEKWHSAKPILRVLRAVQNSSTSAVETVDRDIEIHGGVNNWFIDVKDPPHTFRVEIGYLSSCGKFFGVARSNSVTTPKTNSSDLAARNWADMANNCDKILAQSGAYSEEGNDGELRKLFEERLRRPMGSPMLTRYGIGAESVLQKEREFTFDIDAEMIVFGSTQPDAHVVMGGDPVKVRSDGTFTIRMSLKDGRQVLPVVACSGDGMQEQTIILAVERNTKTMEPVARDEAS